MADDTSSPTYLAVAETSSNWITVRHNSFSYLSNWCEIISEQLATKVIVTIAQSVSDFYYFSMYENGQKVREISVCYSDDSNSINFGNKFDFENEQPGKKEIYNGDIEYYFGFEEIEDYCKHFELTIQTDYYSTNWCVLKSGIKSKMIKDVVTQQIANSEKPWWKFW